MATITITIGNDFLAAIQEEAAIDGIGAQAWGKSILKKEIKERRIARLETQTEATRQQTISTAATQALETKEAAMTALITQIDALT